MSNYFMFFQTWNPTILSCILNVLRQYSTCESTKDRKELRNNQENYVVVHISLVTPFPDGSAIHLFWLIIVVASFELKEVTGCPMANWQTPWNYNGINFNDLVISESSYLPLYR